MALRASDVSVNALLVVLATLAPLRPAPAQTGRASGFPADAVPIDQALFDERVAGHTYRGVTSGGADWIMSFGRNGRFVFLHGVGAQGGRWHVSGELFCSETGSPTEGCNEFRVTDDAVFYKRRGSGEVVKLSPIPPVDPAEARRYVGRWLYRYTDLYRDGDLVVDDAAGGRYHVNTTPVAIKSNPCWGFDWPVVVLVMSPQEFAAAILPTDVLKGCDNLGLVARFVDEQTLETNWGDPRRKLKRP